jgi:hypothetical protein
LEAHSTIARRAIGQLPPVTGKTVYGQRADRALRDILLALTNGTDVSPQKTREALKAAQAS